jgi:hypothetical protein
LKQQKEKRGNEKSADCGIESWSGARFEVFTAAVLRIQLFWDVTSCRLVNGYLIIVPSSSGGINVPEDYNTVTFR